MSKEKAPLKAVPTPAPEKAPSGATPAGGKSHGGGHGVHTSGGKSNNVIALPGMCMAEGCKHKSEKANFCMEHFDWFKEGLITKEGRKPTDFERKHFHYMRRKQAA